MSRLQKIALAQAERRAADRFPMVDRNFSLLQAAMQQRARPTGEDKDTARDKDAGGAEAEGDMEEAQDIEETEEEGAEEGAEEQEQEQEEEQEEQEEEQEEQEEEGQEEEDELDSPRLVSVRYSISLMGCLSNMQLSRLFVVQGLSIMAVFRFMCTDTCAACNQIKRTASCPSGPCI